jgi:hypothetical protein
MRRVIALLIVFSAVALASTTAATTAKAGLGLFTNCGSESQVFAAWNDSSQYYFASNGGFENGSTGWKLSGGAYVGSGNDAYQLSGAGTHAVTLGSGATASINVCYGLTYPAARFTASGVGGSATIHVTVVAHSLLGILSILDGGTFTVPAGWDAAPKLSTLFSALAAPLGTSSMELRITSVNGTAQVDDLYVDPFLTRS